MSRHIVMVDVETNGRYVRAGHRAWEVAYWNLTTGKRGQFFVHLGEIGQFLAQSEPVALRLNRFLDRYPLDETAPSRQDTESAMIEMMHKVIPAEVSEVPILIGSNPAFDLGFLAELGNRFTFDPEKWFHHHPIDLGSYAAGVLGITPGTQSLGAEAVARLCGVTPGDHTAGGDVTAQGRSFLLLDYVARAVKAGVTGGRTPAAMLTDLSRQLPDGDVEEFLIGSFGLEPRELESL